VNRPFLSLSFVAAALVANACTADLEEACLAGPCNVDVQATASSTTGAAGAGGAGGVDGMGGMGGMGGAPVDCSVVPTTGQFPCDVYDVLVAQCHKCHQDPPLNAAPFPLLQFEKTREIYGIEPIWMRMQAVIASGFMPLAPNPDLMGLELQTMQDWFAACAPPVPDGMGCEGP
jgi:hypothetical protein